MIISERCEAKKWGMYVFKIMKVNIKFKDVF